MKKEGENKSSVLRTHQNGENLKKKRTHRKIPQKE
jgi:hypothetical protein